MNETPKEKMYFDSLYPSALLKVVVFCPTQTFWHCTIGLQKCSVQKFSLISSSELVDSL